MPWCAGGGAMRKRRGDKSTKAAVPFYQSPKIRKICRRRVLQMRERWSECAVQSTTPQDVDCPCNNNDSNNNNNSERHTLCDILRACKTNLLWHIRLRRLNLLHDSNITNKDGEVYSLSDLLHDETQSMTNVPGIFHDKSLKENDPRFADGHKTAKKQMRWWDKGTALILKHGKISSAAQARVIASYDWLNCPGNCGKTIRVRNTYGSFVLNQKRCPPTCPLYKPSKLLVHKGMEKIEQRAHRVRLRLLPVIFEFLKKARQCSSVDVVSESGCMKLCSFIVV
jgi:hypothetical protein